MQKRACLISLIIFLLHVNPLISDAFGRSVYLFEGDRLDVPDDWEYHRGNPIPPDQPGMLFSAASRDGCGIRMDSAGLSQKAKDFITGVEQFDDYITQLFARSGVKIIKSSRSEQSEIAGFRALEKSYEFEQNGSVHKAKILQFNSEHHLYNAGIVVLSDSNYDECVAQGKKILNSFKSK